MDDAIDGRRTALYSVQPACALSLGFRSYRLVFAGRKAINNPVQAWLGSFRLSETGVPCT